MVQIIEYTRKENHFNAKSVLKIDNCGNIIKNMIVLMILYMM